MTKLTKSGLTPTEPHVGTLKARVAFAAAHVVADPSADNTPGQPAQLDWEATLAFRHHLWDHGLGVAEAMDTAQRGMGLDWPNARELIERTGAEARARGARVAAGVNTDEVAPATATVDDVTRAYLDQLDTVEAAGAQPIVMASRALARAARHAEDYREVYGHVLSQSSRPVILHWLGDMFDPQLRGYWGSVDLNAATNTVVDLIAAHREKVDGIKVSLLDAEREVALRTALPPGVRLYTGDDFHYPQLIRGDDQGHSDALLGVFDPIAPIAAAALRRLDAGDADGFEATLNPTLPLARHLFGAPTFQYKTGIVFLAWLAGHQSHFTMVGGAQAGRSAPHLLELARLAGEIGLLRDADLAEQRLRAFRDVSGLAP